MLQDSVHEAELIAAVMPGLSPARRWSAGNRSHHVTDLTQHDSDRLDVESVKRTIFCQQILRGVVVYLFGWECCNVVIYLPYGLHTKVRLVFCFGRLVQSYTRFKNVLTGKYYGNRSKNTVNEQQTIQLTNLKKLVKNTK